jgi:hypothetical protein
MISLNYDRFFIHSSLKSNMLDNDGKRSDLLTVCTLSTADYDNVLEYVPLAEMGRDYCNRDNLSSIKNFYIEVKDSAGNEIKFEDVGGFEMEIVIWMSPNDP